MASRRSGTAARGGAGDSAPRLDLRQLRSYLRGRSRISGDFTDSAFPRPNLGRFQSGLRRGLHIRAGIIMYSGLPGFDLPLLHPLPRGWHSPAALSPPRTGATLPGGNSFPCLDPGTLPWGWLTGRMLLPWGRRRWRICRYLLRRWVCGSARLPVRLLALGGLFLLQQSFHTAPRLIGPTDGGILNPVAAVVAGLSTLGGLTELAPQAFRTIIQPTANKLFRRSFSFFF